MAGKKSRKSAPAKGKRPAKGFNWNLVAAFALGVVVALGLAFAAQRYVPSLASLTGLFGGRQTAVAPMKPQAPPAGQTAPAQTAQQTAQPQTPLPAAQPANQPSAPPQAQPPQPETVQPQPGKPQALLAVVIDDLGSSLPQAEAVVELRLPLTGSVLPGLSQTKAVDALLAKAGLEVLLHQPMEAWNSPADAPGPGGLRTGMTAKEVAAIMETNLAQTPHAVGVNNHMGSKASEDAALMERVMAVLKAKGLFFLDSKTSERSVGEKQAAKARVPALARAVFLDNERGQQSAILMLKEAERQALAKGRAVAIGHPHPETLAALAAWDVRRDQRVRLVPLSRLLKTN